MTSSTLEDQFGQIDIYLFDQLLRRRIVPGMRVLDAACGGGRNLVYLLREHYDVYAIDRNHGAVAAVRSLGARLHPALPDDHFRTEPVERMSFADAMMDVVISNSVLHFATGHAHFEAMVSEMWRVLRPGGLFFCRVGSTIGMEQRMRPLEGGRFLLPDGAEWYLVDEARLLETATRLGGVQLDPLKTTIVQDQRCMTTWVLRKAATARG